LGVELKIQIPGFPATDVPVDAGGPTSQAAADSLGSSTGYAALPDPGQFVTTVPGFATGLLAGGAAGLPPIKLPALPNYPLFVSSDVNSAPDVAVGSGPYQLTAKSAPQSSKATASGGLQTGILGNLALVQATASVSVQGSSVISTATTDMQGLTVGPLTLGEVKSTATMTEDASGNVKSSSSLEISAVKIAGLPVSITPSGLQLPGPTVPLPINATLNKLMGSAKITSTVVTAQSFPDRVIAPAMTVTMPFSTPRLPQLGQFNGTVSLTFGAATASLSAISAAGASEQGGSAGLSGGGPLGSPGGGPLDGVGSGRGPSGETASPVLGSSPLPASSVAGSPQVAAPAPALAGGGTRSPGPSLAAGRLVGWFDVRSVYLVLLGAGLVAAGLGWLIRVLGVRRPWTSIGG
jgi:hypothetical protein